MYPGCTQGVQGVQGVPGRQGVPRVYSGRHIPRVYPGGIYPGIYQGCGVWAHGPATLRSRSLWDAYCLSARLSRRLTGIGLDLSSRGKVAGGPLLKPVPRGGPPRIPPLRLTAHLRYSLRWLLGSLGGCGPPALPVTSPFRCVTGMVPLRYCLTEGLERSRGGPGPLAQDLSDKLGGF